jgi:hypothetical protein
MDREGMTLGRDLLGGLDIRKVTCGQARNSKTAQEIGVG